MKKSISKPKINYNSIFYYILAGYKNKIINETDFKNRCFYILYKLYFSKLSNENLIQVDNFFIHYEKFYNHLLKEKIIKFRDLKNFNIISNLETFKFSTDKNINKISNNTMLLPAFYLRFEVKKILLSIDQKLYKHSYNKFFSKTESKNYNIGKPFFYKRNFSNKGIIIIHGYMSAPEEIKIIAKKLFKEGYTVYGVRLTGHGTSPNELATTKWHDWYNSISRAQLILENSVNNIYISGFSTGAGLALLQAANKKNKFKGIISINAPLYLKNISTHLSSTIVNWNNFLNKLKFNKGKMEFINHTPENPHINYQKNPIHGLNELRKAMSKANKIIHNILIPSLIIQGSNDPIVSPNSGKEIFKKIKANQKYFHTIETDRHGIVRGKESGNVLNVIIKFLKNIN